MSLPKDVREEGLSIGLLLTRPATEADVEGARDLLEVWLDRYDDGAAIRHGNCGVEGDVGARLLRLWCDRLDDPDGHDAALAHARSVASRARSELPIAGTKLGLAEEPAKRDLDDRLGGPVVTVRPGGDLVGDMMAAGLIPRPPGLRPHGVYVFGVALAALACGLPFEPPTSWWARAITMACGVAGLAIASRRWCATRAHGLAALVVVLALVQPLALAAGAAFALLTGLAQVVAFVVWASAWTKRR